MFAMGTTSTAAAMAQPFLTLHISQCVPIFLKFAAAISGALCVYAGAFLYEDEAGRIQNKLEEWWVATSDIQVPLLERHTAFTQRVARLASSGFDRLFGERIVAPRAVAASMCCSYYSCILFTSAVSYIFLGSVRGGELFVAALGILFGVFFVVSAKDGFSRRAFPTLADPRDIALVIAFAVLTLLFIGNMVSQWRDLDLTPPQMITLSPGYLSSKAGERLPDISDHHLALDFAILIPFMLGSFAADAALIALTRWILRWASTMDRYWKLLSVIVLNVALASSFVIIPLHFAKRQRNELTLTLSLLTAANIVDTLAALAFVFLALLLIVHRLFWPAISRPLYFLQGIGIARRGKLFVIIGFALLGYALYRVPELLRRVMEASLE
jgi:hypothetical protein